MPRHLPRTFKRAILIAPLSLALAAASPPATIAGQLDTGLLAVSDGADRIELADRLTMLTQRVAAASCALTSDIAVEESHDVLEDAAAEFETIVRILRDGDPKFHVTPEENRRILHDIEELWSEWSETRGAIAAVLTDGHDVDSAHIIDDHNLSLMEKASTLSSDIAARYSHPFQMSQLDSMMVELAGRQRMLTQKMAKDACEIWTHYHEDTGRADLAETMDIFEQSLKALRFGHPALGLPPAPNEQIAEDLDRLLARWEVARGNEEILLATGELDEEGKVEIFHDLNLELLELDTLIEHYVDHAQRHH